MLMLVLKFGVKYFVQVYIYSMHASLILYDCKFTIFLLYYIIIN
jgi:hypothetical protein